MAKVFRFFNRVEGDHPEVLVGAGEQAEGFLVLVAGGAEAFEDEVGLAGGAGACEGEGPAIA